MNPEKRIESLEGQVRTLNATLAKQSRTFKRMFYGFGCLVVAGIALAATSIQGPTSGNFTDLTCTSLTVNDGAIKIMEAGKMTTKLYSDSGGDGQVKLYNSAGNMCAQMYGDSDGDGRLRLYQTDGTEVVNLYANKYGGWLKLNNEDGNTIAQMNPIVGGGGGMSILNNDGWIVSQMSSNTFGGSLMLLTEDGKLAANVYAFTDGGVLELYDKDGDVSFEKP